MAQRIDTRVAMYGVLVLMIAVIALANVLCVAPTTPTPPHASEAR